MRDCASDMRLVRCLGWRSSQRLFLIGPQHTATQLRIKFKGLRRPQHGGSSEKVLLVNKSFVVTSAGQCDCQTRGQHSMVVMH